MEVRHKVVERNAPPRPIPSPKGSTAGADGAPSDAVEPHGAYVPPSRRSAPANANDAKPARGVIPLPKGHVALDGAPAPAPAVAGEKKTSKRGGKRRDASGEGERTTGWGRGGSRRPPTEAAEEEKKSRRRRRTTGVNRAVAQASGRVVAISNPKRGRRDAFEEKARIGAWTTPRALIQVWFARIIFTSFDGGGLPRERKMKMPRAPSRRSSWRCRSARVPWTRWICSPRWSTASSKVARHPQLPLPLHQAHRPEFLEEALQTLDRVANAPAFGLQESGLAAMDVVIHPSLGGQLSLNIPAGRRAQRVDEGDTVLLSRTGEAARSMGDAEMPTGPREVPSRCRQSPRRLGGARSAAADARGRMFEFEAEVSTVEPRREAHQVRTGGVRARGRVAMR